MEQYTKTIIKLINCDGRKLLIILLLDQEKQIHCLVL